MKPLVLLFLAFSVLTSIGKDATPIKALMITGGCCHEYDKQKFILSQGISARANVEWTIVHQGGATTNTKIPYYQNKDWYKGFDVVLHNECFAAVKDTAFIEQILAPHRAGLPSVVVHCAMHSYRANDPEKSWKAYLGVESPRHGPHFAFRVDNVKPEHTVMSEFGKSWMTPKGELYHIDKVYDTATPLAVGTRQDGKTKDVCIWINQYGKGRVFGTTIGHHKETMEQPEYLDMITRGLLWSVGKLDQVDYTQPAKSFVAKQIGEVSKPVEAPTKKKAQQAKKMLENLALNKAASGSPHQAQRDHKFAFDGKVDTRWCGPDGRTGHTLQVDLGGLKQIRGVRILWELENSRYGYKVEGSADGKTWNMLSDQTGRETQDQLHELEVAAYDIRYVRVTPTQLQKGWGSIWEMEVLGTKEVNRVDILSDEAGPAPAPAHKTSKKITVPTGYTASVFGPAPKLAYPTCLTVGSDNWVYVGLDPNGSLGKDPKHNGKIVRARDTDGDGEADEFQTCVEGIQVPPLNTFNPRGMFVHGNTMIVLHPPELSRFKDKDGDGTFEDRKVLVQDISSPSLVKARGADHCTNGFVPGIDGWLYIAVGDFGFFKATGSDGKELQLYGGGIVRVRPDGSKLELYARGLRNIYDVAVSPLLECFTRDNTNDGGGWNVRLSHVIGGQAEYGYPYLFKNFPEDHIPRLEDYGGGSPCGSLWLDEPTESGLFTCDWGRSVIYRHPLEAKGADYASQQEPFITVPRPTDMDVDFNGNLYISSWENGRFSYSSDHVGFVAMARPDSAGKEVLNFAGASEADLLNWLASGSHKRRLHAQWELLARNATGAAQAAGELAVSSSHSDAVRTAGLFTMLQLDPSGAKQGLEALSRDPDDNIRAMALRALADRPELSPPAQPFVAGLGGGPKTRLQATIGLGRLGDQGNAPALIKALGDQEPLIQHAAVKALGQLEAIDACLSALGQTQDEATRRGLLQTLDGLHSEAVVEGLLARLKVDPQPGIYRALCRLYHKEDNWSGAWWSTRPDTRGPYYKPVTWKQTPIIATALQQAIDRDEETRRLLLTELPRHRIKLEGVTKMLLATAKDDPAFADKALDVLLDESNIPSEAIGLLKRIGMDDAKTGQRRGQALYALDKVEDSAAAAAAALDVIASIAGEHEKGFRNARNDYLRSGKRARDVDVFIARADASTAALSIVTSIAGNPRGDKAAKAKASGYITKALGDETKAIGILNAMGSLKLGAFESQIRELASDTRPAVAKRAGQIAQTLKIDLKPVDPSALIGQMKYEDIVKVVNSTKGDPKAGATFYQTTGCIACHTTRKDEPLKGPYLGDITTRYNRTQLTESIIKPNAIVATAFASHWFELKNKTLLEGFVIRESGDEIEIRNIAGLPALIKTTDITKRGKREVSMMPAGLTHGIKPTDLASLLAFLESLTEKK